MKTLRLKHPHVHLFFSDILKGRFKKPAKFIMLKSVETAIFIVNKATVVLSNFQQVTLVKLRGKIFNMQVNEWEIKKS